VTVRRLLVGGARPPEGLATGYYHRPTVFTDVAPGSELATEEVFGPVLAVQTYADGPDDAAAVELANSTDYGLAAGVWSADPARARAVGRRLRAGQVKVNGVRTRDSLDAPFGGTGDPVSVASSDDTASTSSSRSRHFSADRTSSVGGPPTNPTGDPS
jgi:NAD-dependent aldehyde dehydrogenases